MPEAKNLLTEPQQQKILDAIKAAEHHTSGEIRVHLENHAGKEVLLRAEEVFLELEMQKTKNRNAVLIYVAVKGHQLAIIGDKGINDLVGHDFWKAERDLLIEYFSKNNYTEGLTKAITLIGEQLKKHFPATDESRDELSNEISFKKAETK